jgi:hypothetical protein
MRQQGIVRGRRVDRLVARLLVQEGVSRAASHQIANVLASGAGKRPAPVLQIIDALESFVIGGSSAPTLNALTSPLLSSANGGGPTVILSGSNLTGVTGVTVGGTAATGVSSGPTTVNFTMPANTASATPVSIVVTTASGSATLTNAVYVLPANVTHAWYAGMDYFSGTWTDIVGSVALTAALSGFTAPTITSSWQNSQPALNFGGSNALQIAATVTQAQPGSMFVVADRTSTTNYGFFLDGGTAGHWQLYGTASGGAINQYIQGGTGYQSTFNALTPGFLLEGFFDTSSSEMFLNNGASTTTGTVGSGSQSGLTVGAQYNGNGTIVSGLVGHIALALIYNGTPSGGDRTIIHGISQALYGTP